MYWDLNSRPLRSRVRTASLQFARPEAGWRTSPTEAGSRKIMEEFYRDRVCKSAVRKETFQWQLVCPSGSPKVTEYLHPHFIECVLPSKQNLLHIFENINSTYAKPRTLLTILAQFRRHFLWRRWSRRIIDNRKNGLWTAKVRQGVQGFCVSRVKTQFLIASSLCQLKNAQRTQSSADRSYQFLYYMYRHMSWGWGLRSLHHRELRLRAYYRQPVG